MSWPSFLTIIEVHAPICTGHPSYINNPPMAKSLTPVCTSKGLSNSANLSMGCKDNLLLNSPKTWWQGSSHSWDSHILHKLNKVRQASSFMLSYAMVIHLGSTSANGKILRLHVHFKMLAKTRVLDHILQKERALEFPKSLVTRLIPLLR